MYIIFKWTDPLASSVVVGLATNQKKHLLSSSFALLIYGHISRLFLHTHTHTRANVAQLGQNKTSPTRWISPQRKGYIVEEKLPLIVYKRKKKNTNFLFFLPFGFGVIVAVTFIYIPEAMYISPQPALPKKFDMFRFNFSKKRK